MSNRSIGKQISEISRNLSRYTDIKTGELGLTSATVPFIAYLLDRDGVHQEEMAEKLHFDKSSATRAVTALEKLGYVKRVTDKNNKRRNLIYITKKAESIRTELFSALSSLTADLFEGFSEEERESFFAGAKKIDGNLIKLLGKDK